MTNFSPAISFDADKNYIKGLDGVRAISILIVIISHFGFGNIIPGGLGVTIFFFVSGFLITRLLVAETKQYGKIDLSKFYIRRFLRLMPALYVFIASVYILGLAMGVKPTNGQTFAAFAYLANYYDVLTPYIGWEKRIVPWGHLWSLAIEEHFYLIFPFTFAFFAKSNNAKRNLLIGVIIFEAIWRAFLIKLVGVTGEYTYAATDTRLDSLAWGCLLAVLMDGFGASPQKLRHFSGLASVILALGLVGFSLVYRSEDFRAIWRYSLQGMGIFLLIFNLYSFAQLKFAITILELPIMRFIGRLSYSLYLWHFPVLWVFASIYGFEVGEGKLPIPSAILAVLLSLLLASMSYYLIERPFFALRKRFGGKPVEEMR